jgi:hypothetical protein
LDVCVRLGRRLERFGQAADGAPPLRNQKFADSPVEKAVSSEPVSENRKFPASWVNTGKFIDFGL